MPNCPFGGFAFTIEKDPLDEKDEVVVVTDEAGVEQTSMDDVLAPLGIDKSDSMSRRRSSGSSSSFFFEEGEDHVDIYFPITVSN